MDDSQLEIMGVGGATAIARNATKYPTVGQDPP